MTNGNNWNAVWQSITETWLPIAAVAVLLAGIAVTVICMMSGKKK